MQAKRRLADAWQVLDGTDGAAPGVEDAFKAALAGIDRIYALEQASEYNADVASPAKVQEFWDALDGGCAPVCAVVRREKAPLTSQRSGPREACSARSHICR